MTLPFWCRLILACAIVFATHAHASSSASSQERANALKLSSHPYWHLLLHYEANGSGWRSEATSPAFFLSADGRENPAGELQALLKALETPADAGDSAVACRFPARSAWLQERLQLTPTPASCPALSEWVNSIHPDQATLVFASDYLNNPSSMFGHTFLRLDAKGQTEDTRLLAYAVNYAAFVQTKNPLNFAWNGLTGGFPGTFSLLPYYEKVREYSDMENRDLWEYQLTFTPEELQRLLQHLWELRDIEFPYYFLTHNCSYQLLSLLEAARPGLDLRSAFPVQAIPSDTVRRVLEEQGILRTLVFRPSAERRLQHDVRNNPPHINQLARQLAAAPQTATTLPPEQTAAALQTAYDYRFYQFMAGDNGPGSSQQLRQLLLRRAAINVPDLRTPPPTPVVDPAQGHATARIALTAGEARGSRYIGLRLRPAYHDLLDPVDGYRSGAHIDFLDTELRLDEESQRLRLESLKIVDIDSLSPWDSFFSPWSWFMGFGQRQAAVDSKGRFNTLGSHGVGYLDAGGGVDLAMGKGLECYLMLAGSIEAGSALDMGWRAGTGPRAGCLYRAGQWRMRLQADGRHYNDIGSMEIRNQLEAQFDLSSRNALRLGVGQIQHQQQHRQQGELSWLHYF